MKLNFSPSKEFLRNAKGRFLASFDARYPVPRPATLVLAMKALSAVLGVVVLTLGGASVYADTQNVPADSPLYPLKRLNESVQLALTKSQTKPNVAAALAVRRADEIDELTDRHPTSSLLPKLADDLNVAINTSIDSLERLESTPVRPERGTRGESETKIQTQTETQVQTQIQVQNQTETETQTQTEAAPPRAAAARRFMKSPEACDKLGALFGASSSAVRDEIEKHEKTLQRFLVNCENDNEDRSEDGAADESSLTSTPPPFLIESGDDH